MKVRILNRAGFKVSIREMKYLVLAKGSSGNSRSSKVLCTYICMQCICTCINIFTHTVDGVFNKIYDLISTSQTNWYCRLSRYTMCCDYVFIVYLPYA